MKGILNSVPMALLASMAFAEPTVAPFGGWSSPLSIDSVTSSTRRLTDVLVDRADVVVLEQRSDEEGRTVAVLLAAQATALTPPGFNVDTRVHEYGGAPALVSDGVLYFSNKGDGRLYAQSLRSGAAPHALTAEGPYRYADCALDSTRKRLICVREDHSDDRPSAVKNALVAIPLTRGSAVTLLFDDSDFVASPRVSRDGGHVAFIAWNHPNMPWDVTGLQVARFNEAGTLTDAQVVVDAEQGVSVMQPSWARDGTLYFINDESGWWNIWRWSGAKAEPVAPLRAEIGGPMWRMGRRDYVVLEDGTLIAVISENGASRLAALTPSTRKYSPIATPYVAFDAISADGHIAYAIAAAADRAPEVIAIKPRQGVTVLRKESSQPLPAAMVSTAQSITFDNREGQRVQAFYYPPRNARYRAPTDAKPPLVVRAHGGPTSMSSPAYRENIQFWTTRGIAVLEVNYSGSTSFGTAYRKRLNGRWGEIDVNDVVDAAKAVAARGLVDPKRMVVRGGSAGGFVVLSVLAFQSDVFVAGVNYFGVSDLATMARDTHKFESHYLDTLVGPLPQAQAIYMQRSPLSVVGNIRAPLLTLQGLDDKIVPAKQSESIMERVAANGVPSAYIAFQGEGHGFRGGKAQKAALEAELSFLGQVLGFTPADAVAAVPLRRRH